MSTFANAVSNRSARTANGMKARATSANACVDLFYNIGASRGKDIIPAFVAAYAENRDLAVRIALWARDVRGGAGERKLFRDILNYVATQDVDLTSRIIKKVPVVGRFDDLLAITDPIVRGIGHELIRQALNAGNGLAAKWMPRKGAEAVELRSFLGMTPKQYRKTLVNLTKVVETQMCARDWDNINFSHVPSLASSRYKKAFARRTAEYGKYVEKLKSGDKSVKVNAAAVYPYDILKGVCTYGMLPYGVAEQGHIVAQWNALPDYVGDAAVLPIIDVSGSMGAPVQTGNGKRGTMTCMDVSISLGLYLAEKNKGKFKDLWMTFSSKPKLYQLRGDILQRVKQMDRSNWEMSTDLHAAMQLILDTATKGNVPQDEMPKTLLILSDMQFNSCARYDDSAIQMIRRKFGAAGYTMPNVVFWNLNAYDNSPVRHDESGVALVSGFSPAIAKSVLSSSLENFTPENIMLQTVMSERYNF